VSSGQVRGQFFSRTCEPGLLFDIDSGSSDYTRVAAHEGGYAVVWQESGTGLPKRRFFGPNLCD
jgi:hypothetical protein